MYDGTITNSDEEDTPPQHHKVDDLLGCADELHAVMAADPLHRDDHGRSCMGHRIDEEVVRPWHRKDRQGIGHVVGHTHQVLPCDHAEGSDHSPLHRVYHKIHEEACVGDNRRGVDYSHVEDRDGHSSRCMDRGDNHRRGGPWVNESGTYHGRGHLVRPGLRREPWA